MSVRSYQLIRSGRKTVALQIKDGELLVRAPMKMRRDQIDRFVSAHEAWIVKHLQKAAQKPKEPLLGEQELKELSRRAREEIPRRVAYYAPLVGVNYGKITIRCQRTRWGSCSSGGNLSFNCLLMLVPPEVLDSVVVHELCHRKQMNHSAAFYKEVLRVYPAYHHYNGWLKEHGGALMKRVARKE